MPARAEDVTTEDIVSGLYRWSPAPDGIEAKATVVFSGTAQKAAREAQAALAERGIGVELWSATSYKALREDALGVERWNRLHPLEAPRTAAGHRASSAPPRARSSPSPTS